MPYRVEKSVMPIHPFCSVHGLLYFPSIREWLPYTLHQVLASFGSEIAIGESTCPKCLATAQQLMQTQYPALYR